MEELKPELVVNALAILGQNNTIREKAVNFCREAEDTLSEPGKSIRDEVTGPIIDALHKNVGTLRKTLSNGIKFEFHYKSKIARDFVMAVPERPDHVWEPQTTKLLLHLARGAKHVVIGGAYSGDQAILVADVLQKSGGICHAFEPNNEQFEMLLHNAELNSLPNIRANRIGLWSDCCTKLRLVGFDSFAHPEVADEGAQDETTFSTTTLDEYVGQQGIKLIDLIMLDIEGAELEVLRGAEHLLSLPTGAAPNLIFEVHRHYVDWAEGLANTEIIMLLERYGYQIFAIRDFNSNVNMAGLPVEIIPHAEVYLEGPPHGFNMLAVKDRTIIEKGPFRICHNVSPKLLIHKDPALHHPMDWVS